MPKKIILLSGRIGAGKSALADLLQSKYGAIVVRTSELLARVVGKSRRDLQREGERLDRESDGGWVARALADFTGQHDSGSIFVLDSVRIPGQANAIHSAFPQIAYHIHLTANESILRERFDRRRAEKDSGISFDEAQANRTERQVERLADIADLVIDTGRSTPEAVCVRATGLIGLVARSVDAMVDVLVGGQYGSEGKGNIVGHIAPEYELLVRVGGPNAGHKVFDAVQPFYHIPSGASRSAAHLLLGAGSVLLLGELLDEIQKHQLSVDRLSIDPQAMMIVPDDIALEKQRLMPIGSTGRGVGAASARKIMDRGDVATGNTILAKDEPALRPYIRDSQDVLEPFYRRGQPILLEGTQGTSLSLHHGPYPWVTSRDTTASGCLADAGISPRRVRRIVMVCRTYPIRVAEPSGPMEGEISYEEVAARSGLPVDEIRKTEITTTTKRPRRIAEFDWLQLRRSAVLNGPTDIALTFVDYISKSNQRAFRFDQLTPETLRFIEEVERVTGVPVSMISTHFGWRNVIDRRSW